jgi:predicted DNA-binding antitoxin AbrB/MazE fold protein
VAKMTKTIEVVYEGGVFKPLEKVELKEGEQLKVEIKKLPETLFGVFRGKDLMKLLKETEDEWGIY